MSLVQKLFTKLVPASWARAAEAESRAWIIRCPCGHQRSVWDAGGIRWQAAGNPRRLLRCPACANRTWHTFARTPAADPSAGDPETAAR